jgi:hypothetical protein
VTVAFQANMVSCGTVASRTIDVEIKLKHCCSQSLDDERHTKDSLRDVSF